MELEADLIEELARFYGYQNIPAVLPPSKTAGTHSPVYVLENSIRNIMVGQGYSEAVNLSFASEADHREFPPLEGEPCRGKKSSYRGHPIYAHDAGAGSGAIGKAELQFRPATDPAF